MKFQSEFVFFCFVSVLDRTQLNFRATLAEVALIDLG